MRLFVCLVVLAFIDSSNSWQLFMRGRARHGNLGVPYVSEERKLPEEKWFVQLLDSFAPSNNQVWNQRYFVNADYYKKGGPVFLMIGGEGPASAKWMVEGQWIEYAKHFGAMCFQLEHRYYGKSHPSPDLSTNKALFLSSEQALADLAYFITAMNDEYKFPNNTKWITFGGSYAGSLAVWMREKYPHLVHGAVSASGPLLAQIDFREYFLIVENALKEYSEDCVKAIAEGNRQFHIMLRHPIGQQGIDKKFSLCDPIDNGHTKQKDISNLYQTLASNLAGVVQYNKDNRNNSQMANLTIDKVCDILVDERIGLAVDRIANISNMILKASNKKCLDYTYEKMIHELRNITWDSESEGGRQWMYQTCTEFGFFQTSSALPNLFFDAFPVDFFIQQCVDIFGPKYGVHMLNHAVKHTNIVYGGLNVDISNVVFVHGSTDPWHALGVIRSSNPKAPAIYINGTAHCASMYPSSENDIPELKAAREKVRDLIGEWLAQ